MDGVLLRISFLLTLLVLLFSSNIRASRAYDGEWGCGHATFYGGNNGSGTMAGACGYGDLYKHGYGNKIAAVSPALFNNGASCGSCYEIKCDASRDRQWCTSASASVMITVTDLGPPDYAPASEKEGSCNPPLEHFDMSVPAFVQIAQYNAGIVPILFRRVPCLKTGGVQFTINGTAYFNLVLVTNVGGAGDVSAMWIKGSKSNTWQAMKRNWGANWQSNAYLVGEALSSRVSTSDGRSITANDVAPPSWQFGQTFESSAQF